MRVAWGKGNGGVGLGARGSCQGVLGGRGPPSTGSGRTDSKGARDGVWVSWDATGVGGGGAWPLRIQAFEE